MIIYVFTDSRIESLPGSSIVVTAVCVSVPSLAAFPHYCTDPNVSWGNGGECP